MVNYECAFSQSELGKYFEWIIIMFIYSSKILSVEENEHGDSVCIIRSMSSGLDLAVKRFPCYNPDGTVADKVDEGQTSFCGWIVCVIKHIQLSQFRHTLNYGLKWIPRSFWALNLNNGSWSTVHVLGNEDREKCNTRTTMWGETYKCRGKTCRVNLKERRQNSFETEYNQICQGLRCFSFQ